MILGRGTIAKAIIDRENFSFLCFGVSNREPLTEISKEKEHKRIWETKNSGMIVYFSSLSIYHSPNTEYSRHKRAMELFIKGWFDNYCIFRIGNVTWENDNPNTLLNFLRNKIKNNEPFETQNTYRYLISKKEFQHWIKLIPEKGKHEINCTGSMHKVSEIVEQIKHGLL